MLNSPSLSFRSMVLDLLVICERLITLFIYACQISVSSTSVMVDTGKEHADAGVLENTRRAYNETVTFTVLTEHKQNQFFNGGKVCLSAQICCVLHHS